MSSGERPVHAALVSLSPYVRGSCSVQKFLLPRCLSLSHVQTFRLLFSVFPEGRDLMQTSYVELSVLRSAHCLAVGLSICFHLLQAEASLMMAEQATER